MIKKNYYTLYILNKAKYLSENIYCNLFGVDKFTVTEFNRNSLESMRSCLK